MTNPALFTGVAPFVQAPSSADIALIEFNTDFRTAWNGTPPAWASMPEHGYQKPTNALASRYTIPLSQAGFTSFDGEVRYRTKGLRHVSLRQGIWSDGVKDLASNIEAGDFAGFMEEPAAMAEQGKWSPNTWIASDLENGESIASWDSADWQPDVANADGSFGTGSTKFFDTAHPTAIFGGPLTNGAPATWSNKQTAAPLSLATFRSAKAMLRKMMKPNGMNLGLMATHLDVHPDQEEIGRAILEKDLILDDGVMQSNIQKGVVRLNVCPEFVTSGTWYLRACNKPLIRPWILSMAMGGAPEILIRDKSSEFYKEHLMVSFGAVLRGTRRLLWPQSIIKSTA